MSEVAEAGPIKGDKQYRQLHPTISPNIIASQKKAAGLLNGNGEEACKATVQLYIATREAWFSEKAHWGVSGRLALRTSCWNIFRSLFGSMPAMKKRKVSQLSLRLIPVQVGLDSADYHQSQAGRTSGVLAASASTAQVAAVCAGRKLVSARWCCGVLKSVGSLRKELDTRKRAVGSCRYEKKGSLIPRRRFTGAHPG